MELDEEEDDQLCHHDSEEHRKRIDRCVAQLRGTAVALRCCVCQRGWIGGAARKKSAQR